MRRRAKGKCDDPTRQNARTKCVFAMRMHDEMRPRSPKKRQKKASCTWHKACTGVEGLEPSAHGFGVRCSTKLSYAPIDSPPIGRNRQKIKQKRHIDRFSSCAKVRIFATTSICLYKSHQKSPQWRMGSWTICAQGMCAKVATLAA